MPVAELPVPPRIDERASPICVPCRNSGHGRGWSDEIALEAGGHVIGVQVNSVGAAELVRSRFAHRHAPAGSPRAHVSLFLAERTPTPPQLLHRVEVDHRCVLRSRSVRRALDTLGHLLDAADAVATASTALLEATVLVAGDRAHLLPSSMRAVVAGRERRWSRDGLRLVDRALVALDPVAGTVTVPASSVVWTDLDGLRAGELGIADRAEEPTPVGCFPIATWSFAQRCDTPAQRLLRAAGQVRNRTSLDGGALLAALRDLLARTGEVDLDDRHALPRRLGGR